jgi:hypothetical protein
MAWTAKGNIRGPAGATGATGSTGATGQGVPTGGTTGQVLAKASGTNYDTAWVNAASGGGGSGAPSGLNGSINFPPTTANAADDEFADFSGQSGPVNGLATKWGKQGLGDASWLVMDRDKTPGQLMFDLSASASSVVQHITQPAPGGDFRIGCASSYYTTSSRQMWGPTIVDVNGNGIGIHLDTGDTFASFRAVSNWQQTGTLYGGSGIAGLSTSWKTSTTQVFLSLRKSGGTYYASGWTYERYGYAFKATTEIAGTPSAFTPAFISFGRLFGSGAATLMLDWFRIS